MRRAVLIALFLSVQLVKAQTTKLETVTYIIGANDIENALPFDIEFKIQGTAPADVRKISLKYKLKSVDEKSGYPGDTGFTTPVAWENLSGKDSKFSLAVGQLHPNSTYEFHFTVMLRINLSTDQKVKLNEEMAAILKSSFNKDNITDTDVDAAAKALDKRLKDEVKGGGTVTDLGGAEVTVSATEQPLKPVTDRITKLSGIISTASIGLGSSGAAVKNSLDSVKFELQLTNILNNTFSVNAITKNILESALNPTIKGFETVKVKEAALTMISISANRNNLHEIVEGKLKVSGNTVAVSAGIDKPSIQFFLAFFRTLNNATFASDKNVACFAGRKGILDIIAHLQNMEILLGKIEKAESELDKIKTEMPDLLRDLVVSQNYIVTDQPAIDMTAEKNAYIGLDGGLIYVPSMEGFFISQGVNFYFAPVNKKVPLSRIPCKYLFSKMFSVYLGITQKASGPTDDNYKGLFNDAGSLLYGVGLRFNRVCRVGVGGLLFQYKNMNPAINKYELRSSWMFSFSFDIDIIRTFGDFGKAVGLVKS